MNPRPYTIGFLTVLFMVGLRIAVGWHFFQEGLSHKNDPKWSSEGFLRAAKGPLAELYHQRLPSFHGWDSRLTVPLADDNLADANSSAVSGDATDENAVAKEKEKPESSKVFGAWYSTVVHDWTNRRKEIADFYTFTEAQIKSSDERLDSYSDRLAKLLQEKESDIRAYRHALDRSHDLAAKAGAGEIPNQVSRLEKREKNPTGEPGISVASGPSEWRSDVAALEAALERDVAELATDAQRKVGPLPQSQNDLKKIDTAIPWILLVGGACLVAGLFTRTAALVLALFLASIIASQPPWVAGALTTVFNYQCVELVALLTLASSHVGRWGGLDFFIHHLLLRPFRSA